MRALSVYVRTNFDTLSHDALIFWSAFDVVRGHVFGTSCQAMCVLLIVYRRSPQNLENTYVCSISHLW